MTENIKYTRENVENHVGDALKGAIHNTTSVVTLTLVVRQRALAAFRDLGQPDLCYLVKIQNRMLQPLRAFTRSMITKDLTLIALAAGYFHFVLGLDVSNTASIALYYKHLQDNQEEAGFFQSTIYTLGE